HACRIKDLINRAVKISAPRRSNYLLVSHPGVRAVAVVATPMSSSVRSFDATENFRAVVDIRRGEDAGFHDLQDVVVEAEGWILEQATGISNTGYIVGTGTYNGDNRAYLLTPAPNYFLQRWLTKVRQDVLEALYIFGGVTRGGSGWVV